MEPLFLIEDLSFIYAGGHEVKALSGLNLEMMPKSRWAVLGASGCGKSTLLKLLDGLLKPSGGKVLYKGVALDAPPQDIAFVLQDYGLFPWKSNLANLMLPLALRKEKKAVQRERAEEMLATLGLSDKKDGFPLSLSGGQKQRLALGRALITSPSVLLLDEPFSALDALTREQMQEATLSLIKDSGHAMVLVTHSVEEAVYLAEHILLLSEDGAEVVHNPQSGEGNYRDSREYVDLVRTLRQWLRDASKAVIDHA